MKKNILLLGALLLLVGLLITAEYTLFTPISFTNSAAPSFTPHNSALINASPAVPFSFTALHSNQKQHLHDYAGKTVLINFWASWCAPCVKEFPDLIALAKEHPSQLQLLLISVDDSAADIDTFLTRFDTSLSNITVIWDGNKTISQDLYHTTRYPESILISPQQYITHKFAGLLMDADIHTIKSQIKP